MADKNPPKELRGGKRPGAGRPAKFKEPTVLRVMPKRLANSFDDWLSKNMVKKEKQ